MGIPRDFRCLLHLKLIKAEVRRLLIRNQQLHANGRKLRPMLGEDLNFRVNKGGNQLNLLFLQMPSNVSMYSGTSIRGTRYALSAKDAASA